MIRSRFLLAILILACLALVACCQDSSTIGNGKVDPIEEAALQLAVGSAMTAYPQATAPAYLVSTALLELIATDQEATADQLDQVVAVQVDKLDLDQPTRASFLDLVRLIRLKIAQTLASENITDDKLVVVIRQLLEIVQRTAKARM